MNRSIESINLSFSHLPRQPRRFIHDAMATTFGIVIAGEDPDYSLAAAREAFDEIDRLERELSRFIETSDISRINALPAGGVTRVGFASFECLELAAEAWRETAGAFDVAIGPLLAWWRERQQSMEPVDPERLGETQGYLRARALSAFEHIVLDRPTLSVGVCAEGLGLDLGGIGKGYAIDRALDVLREWKIEMALVDSGQSTVRALGAWADDPAAEPRTPEIDWTVSMRIPEGAGRDQTRTLKLGHMALAGSGRLLHGEHIIDPRTGLPAGHAERAATWALAPTAAWADILSTAFMVMGAEEIRDYCSRHSVGAAWLEESQGSSTLITLGLFAQHMTL